MGRRFSLGVAIRRSTDPIRTATARRRLKICLALAALLALAPCHMTLRTVDLVLDPHPDVVYAVPTDAPLLALTLDDGPDPASTPAILAVLARHRARATFFLLGERVAGNEALVLEIVEQGHEIGNHGMRDVPAIDLAPELFESELLEAHEKLAAFQQPRWFRPGSGWYDDWMLEVLARHGYRAALGSSYPLDAHVSSSGAAAFWLRLDAEPGEVIVLHDGGERGLRTAETLGALLPELESRGLRLVTLSELVASAEAPASAG